MPRRGFIAKRDVLPDPIYNSKVVTKLVNNIMLDGKKSVAQGIVYGAFDIIKEKEGKNPLEVFEAALAHEKVVTESIRGILEIAIEEKNYAAENFLRKYVDEQVEEEDTFTGLVDQLKWIGDDVAALLQFDKQLAGR